MITLNSLNEYSPAALVAVTPMGTWYRPGFSAEQLHAKRKIQFMALLEWGKKLIFQ